MDMMEIVTCQFGVRPRSRKPAAPVVSRRRIAGDDRFTLTPTAQLMLVAEQMAIQEAGENNGVDPETIVGGTRTSDRNLAAARDEAAYLLRTRLNYSYEVIERRLGRSSKWAHEAVDRHVRRHEIEACR